MLWRLWSESWKATHSCNPIVCPHFCVSVEQALKGQGENIKEYRIATEIYGRESDFDPRQDNIVRSEARRLRRKLKEYYEGEGQDDEVVIFFRPGSYVPATRRRSSIGEPLHKSPAPLWTEGDGIRTVVAPFDTPKDDAIASASAFGISDEILHRLTRVRGVRAISQSSIRDHSWSGGAGNTAPDKMEPQITISGTVRSERSRLRVTAHIAGKNGAVLWSQRFDASIEGDAPIKLQEAVAAALVARISPRESVVRSYTAIPTPQLYQSYSEALEAESLLEEGRIPTVTDALHKFEKLASKMPGYARLHCGIAQCCVSLVYLGVPHWQELNSKARSACEEALYADPEAVDAHSAMGCVLAYEWKWREAEESFRTALDCGDQSSSRRQFAMFLLAQSRFDEAWKHLQIAQEMDPFSARQACSVTRFLYCSRWHREADEYYATHPQRDSLPLEAKTFRALSEIQKGYNYRAIVLAEDIRKSAVATDTVYAASVAELFALGGQEEVARSLVANMGLLTEDVPVGRFRKASLLLSLGDRAACLRLLHESLLRREPELCWISADPRFDAIRNEAEYQAVVRTVFQT
jgi:TolB-like protein